MKVLLNKLFAYKYTKPILSLILFLFSSYCVYKAAFLITPIVTHERFLLDLLPSILVGLVPLYTFFISIIYNHSQNLCSKWKTIFVYSISLGVTMLACGILHCVMVSNSTAGWHIGRVTISLLYPFDTLIFILLALAIAIYAFIWSLKNWNYKKVKPTNEEVVNKKQYLAFFLFAGFGSWYIGDFFMIFTTIGPRIDTNWYLKIPVFLILLFPLVAIVLFYIYKHHIKEENKHEMHLKLLAPLTGVTIFLIMLMWLNHYINPRYFAESLSNFFLLGYCKKIPIGLYIELGFIVSYLAASWILFFKNSKHLKYEQEQQETNA